jgi:hypothetical protein
MKDVPTWLPDGTVLPYNLPREDTNDAFIAANDEIKKIVDLPDGSVLEPPLYGVSPCSKPHSYVSTFEDMSRPVFANLMMVWLMPPSLPLPD